MSVTTTAPDGGPLRCLWRWITDDGARTCQSDADAVVVVDTHFLFEGRVVTSTDRREVPSCEAHRRLLSVMLDPSVTNDEA